MIFLPTIWQQGKAGLAWRGHGRRGVWSICYGLCTVENEDLRQMLCAAGEHMAFDKACTERIPIMERMIAMQAPICTTRLLPTRVSCRHPMFSLSMRTQHSLGFEIVWLPFPHTTGMRAAAHMSIIILQQHNALMPGKGMHTSLPS